MSADETAQDSTVDTDTAAPSGPVDGGAPDTAAAPAGAAAGKVFRKTVRVGGLHPEASASREHTSFLQEAIQRGLHPRGDVRLLSHNTHDQALNASGRRRETWTEWVLEVDVVPASEDLTPTETTTPRVAATKAAGTKATPATRKGR